MKFYLSALLMLFLLLPAQGYAQGSWEKLGERVVTNHGKNVINCTSKGTFKALKIKVENEDVEFNDITVEFLNGAEQKLNIRQYIREGSESRAIDLRGNKRVIKKVIFDCHPKDGKKSKGKNKPRIILYGR